jgi:hypothetical protein
MRQPEMLKNCENRVLEDVMIGERIGVRSQAVSVSLSLLTYFRRSLHSSILQLQLI